MPSRHRAGPAGWVADVSLATLIVLAPLAAGSWKLEILPLLLALATVGWVAVGAGVGSKHRGLHLALLPAVLLGLSLYTALQAVPLPAELLGAVSPRAQALRAFVQGDGGAGPLSYEPGATWREATKLVLYALVAQLALERARAHDIRDRVAIPLVAAGLAAAAVAVLHRVLGIERLFGLIDTITSPRQMLTTFVNPNHAAGFMVLTTLTAVGLAVDAKDTVRKVAFLAAAALAAAVSVLSLSKGGIGALLFGLALFGLAFAWHRRRRRHGRSGYEVRTNSLPVVAVALLVPVAALLWRLEDLVALLEPNGDGEGLGLVEKAAALQDALPMIREHLAAGIERGAFVSVYTIYTSSSLQLTFAFPENIAAQMVGEWGLAVGGLALVALVTAVLARLLDARRPIRLAMLCGVAAVLIQNLVDFSLELPGMAVPVAAVLGAASAERKGTRRVSGRRPWVWAVIVIAPLWGALTCAMAFSAGDLPRDLDALLAEIRQVLAKGPAPDAAAVEARVARHPASALMAAQAAYLEELRTPPDLAAALGYANRTLYLAPTYAGGHLVAGRLLIRAGARAQGFVELRRAWALSGADTLAQYVDHVLELARTPEEVALAIPRRDPALDVLDEREVARVARRLVERGRAGWGRRLLQDHVEIGTIPQSDLRQVAVAADATAAIDLALAVTERMLAERPDDHATRLLAAQVAFRHGRREAARALLSGLDAAGSDRADLLSLRLRLEIEEGDFEAAQLSLKSLRAHAEPGAAQETELALLERRLFLQAGQPARALDALDAALARRPGSVELRIARAALLLEQGRPEAARSDLQHVITRRPDHPEAHRLLQAVQDAQRGR